MDAEKEFFEIEFKYFADNVKLTAFTKLMENLKYADKLEISSWDTYFVHTENKEEFVRFRNSSTPELTIKRKTKQENNWKRIEIDLPLDPDRISEDTVRAWTELEGYVRKTSLFKTCFIYWFDNVNMVYYIVYDENLTELGRYVEIEGEKNNGLSEDQTFQEIKKYEQELNKLGISPQNRLKRSLFELYVK
jgi:adenylate cyclase class IV